MKLLSRRTCHERSWQRDHGLEKGVGIQSIQEEEFNGWFRMVHQMGSWKEGWPLSDNRVSQELTEKKLCVPCVYLPMFGELFILQGRFCQDNDVAKDSLQKYKVSFFLFVSVMGEEKRDVERNIH